MTWILLAACNGPESDGAGSPTLWVESTLVFDGVDIGTDAPRVERVWVENVGHGTLFVDAPYFADDGAFSVSGESATLERMEAQAYDVTFDPRAPFVHEAALVFESNDPAMWQHRVDVRGEGFAPVLELVTSPIDLGSAQVGCSVLSHVDVHNKGNEVLVVQPSLEGASSGELSLPSGDDPREIAPSTFETITIAYDPVDEDADSATLALESNDPLLPEAAIQLTGAVMELEEVSNLFEMKPSMSDVVFVVDNSGSMDTEQPELVDHIGAFVEVLDDAGVDYRIGVITTDSSDFRGPVVGPGDALDVLATQVAAGTDGSGTARALQMLYNCVLAGNDCSESEGFLRDDALFSAIIVSDGPDQSALSPEDYVEYFWTLEDDPDLVRIHALAGAIPLPTCGTCASAGFGYDEAVELTHGWYLDICAADWDESMRVLADLSIVEPGSFALSQDPTDGTIVVEVDGVQWPIGWTYTGHVADGGTNKIVFDPLPPVGAEIEVRYTIAAVCE